MTIRRSMLAGSLAASLAFAATAMAASAPAPTEASRLASQYSDWAGSRSNADSLIAGLRNGAPITIVTNSPDRSVSIAGFTPASSMSYGGVSSALAAAQHSLARLGIRQPNAEQIQAALIGGEVELGSGRSHVVRGTITPLGGNPNVAAR